MYSFSRLECLQWHSNTGSEYELILTLFFFFFLVSQSLPLMSAIFIAIDCFFNQGWIRIQLVFYGLFISWIYLRFFCVQDGIRGDRSESFSFASFFPGFVQYVQALSLHCNWQGCSNSWFDSDLSFLGHLSRLFQICVLESWSSFVFARQPLEASATTWKILRWQAWVSLLHNLELSVRKLNVEGNLLRPGPIRLAIRAIRFLCWMKRNYPANPCFSLFKTRAMALKALDMRLQAATGIRNSTFSGPGRAAGSSHSAPVSLLSLSAGPLPTTADEDEDEVLFEVSVIDTREAASSSPPPPYPSVHPSGEPTNETKSDKERS